MNKKCLIFLLIALSASIAAASDAQKKTCARQYASDLYEEIYGSGKDKWRWQKRGANVASFLNRFPECKALHGSKQGETELLANAVTYAEQESGRRARFARKAVRTITAAGVVVAPVYMLFKMAAADDRRFPGSAFAKSVTSAVETGAKVSAVGLVGGCCNVLEWDAISQRINVERMQHAQ